MYSPQTLKVVMKNEDAVMTADTLLRENERRAALRLLRIPPLSWIGCET